MLRPYVTGEQRLQLKAAVDRRRRELEGVRPGRPLPSARMAAASSTSATKRLWSPGRDGVCRTLLDGGFSAGQVAALAWEAWGYPSQRSLDNAIRHRLVGGKRAAVPDFNQEQASMMIQDADRSVAA